MDNYVVDLLTGGNLKNMANVWTFTLIVFFLKVQKYLKKLTKMLSCLVFCPDGYNKFSNFTLILNILIFSDTMLSKQDN